MIVYCIIFFVTSAITFSIASTYLNSKGTNCVNEAAEEGCELTQITKFSMANIMNDTSALQLYSWICFISVFI